MKDRMIFAHMRSAFNYAEESYCERRQVGCVIVKDNTIISIGYNGTLPGEDNVCEDTNGNTHVAVIHAEANAMDKLARKSGGGEGSSVFVTTAPCLACAVRLVNTGIKDLYFCENYRDITDGIDLLIKKGIMVYQLDKEQLHPSTKKKNKDQE